MLQGIVVTRDAGKGYALEAVMYVDLVHIELRIVGTRAERTDEAPGVAFRSFQGALYAFDSTASRVKLSVSEFDGHSGQLPPFS